MWDNIFRGKIVLSVWTFDNKYCDLIPITSTQLKITPTPNLKASESTVVIDKRQQHGHVSDQIPQKPSHSVHSQSPITSWHCVGIGSHVSGARRSGDRSEFSHPSFFSVTTKWAAPLSGVPAAVAACCFFVSSVPMTTPIHLKIRHTVTRKWLVFKSGRDRKRVVWRGEKNGVLLHWKMVVTGATVFTRFEPTVKHCVSLCAYTHTHKHVNPFECLPV